MMVDIDYEGLRRDLKALPVEAGGLISHREVFRLLNLYFSSGALDSAHRRLIEEAYDDQDGNTVTLRPIGDGWFEGVYKGDRVMTCTAPGNVLYCLVPQSGNGEVAVLTGRQLAENDLGVVFLTEAEARAYIKGLVAK